MILHIDIFGLLKTLKCDAAAYTGFWLQFFSFEKSKKFLQFLLSKKLKNLKINSTESTKQEILRK